MNEQISKHLDIWTTAIASKATAGRGNKSPSPAGEGRGEGSPNNSRNAKYTAYGIKKLRELILELAVRGKVVAQDPNDEPASVLLEKISNKRIALVNGGILRKQNSMPKITSDEMPFKLPIGWQFVRFGDVTYNRDAERIPLSVDERQGRRGEYDYYGASGVIDSIDAYLFDKTLLLIGEDGANLINRSTPIAFMARGKYWVNNHAHVIDGLTEDLLLYLCLHINAISLVPYVTGTAQPKMNQAKMNTIVLALPPVEEQHRIVTKVDELMALCEQLEQQQTDSIAAHQTLVQTLLDTLTQAADATEFEQAWSRIADHFDTLFTTESSIDQLKQTLLQLAVMGKLVPQDPNDEPAAELLRRIQVEKANLIEEGKINKDKLLTAISEEEKPFESPKGWEWVRLGVVFDITGGVTLGRKLTGADLVELPYLRVANVQRGYLALNSIKTVEIRKSELARYRLLTNDLLVTEGGDWDKVGRTAIWHSQIEDCLHQNHIFRMRSLTKGLSSSWVEMHMNSIAKKYFQAASKQTTNLASINMTQLKNCLLTVPPLREQHRIVAKVDELMAHCDALKARIAAAQTTQIQLADAIVEQVVA